MAKRIIYTDPTEGNVCVVIPSPFYVIETKAAIVAEPITLDDVTLTEADIMASLAEKDVPAGVPFEIVDEADIPTDRTFRNAWKQTGKKISEDMAKCPDVWRDHIRQERAQRFPDLDVALTIADETGNSVERDRLLVEKQKMRDAPADPRIDAAKTPAELKGLTLDALIV